MKANSTAAERLIELANESLSVSSHAVAIWHIPGFYYDKEGHQAAKRLMEADAQAAFATATAYRLTGESVYADKAAELIDGWSSLNVGFADNDGPLVSAYLGTGLILAAQRIRHCEDWSAESRERFIQWITTVCLPAWDGIPGRNNWWSWSLYAQLCAYRFINDIDAIQSEAIHLKAHIDDSLDLSGFIPEETVRGTNGMWYHYFSLAPLTAAAKIVLEETGEDLFRWVSPSGKSLKKALDTLLYYIDGRADEWPFEKDQNVPKPLSAHTWPLDMYEGLTHLYGDPAYERFVAPHRPVASHINANSGYFQSYAWCFPELDR
ncbi:hypothetical protein B1748_15060 [Paenibacillus sp. MY03]|uniref:alginate lyase family protein n=1 Tax=Paenibacillus sp. MY03 TaxID=302980 RepID=UPI000B3C8616|nr:alginate lyase family protein [Paenibacillus sp. MY03]OUS75746.1 hypothetical protein B1748_15060 [Paenibacillus sp. MY03]